MLRILLQHERRIAEKDAGMSVLRVCTSHYFEEGTFENLKIYSEEG